MKKHEPENFAKISKIMLPKDYLAYRLSGAFSTDFSDASGMLLLDVKNRRWSREMCDVCGISEQMLPTLHESYEVVGTLRQEIADKFGLKDVKIIAGAGDNAAAAVGTGVVGEGGCNISLGTSGTLFVSSASYKEDKVNALHSFCHADGGWHLMGCILSAASCNSWWVNGILQSTDYKKEEAGLDDFLGKNDVYFLPYLMGERSPHNDVTARGAFIGMRPDTTRGMMTLAMLEGVTFALRDCLEAAKEERCRDSAHQAVRRRGKEQTLAQDRGECHEPARGHSADGAGTRVRRRHARHGGLRRVSNGTGGGGRDRAGKGDGTARFRYCRTIRGTLSPFHETLSCPQRTVLTERIRCLSSVRGSGGCGRAMREGT